MYADTLNVRNNMLINGNKIHVYKNTEMSAIIGTAGNAVDGYSLLRFYERYSNILLPGENHADLHLTDSNSIVMQRLGESVNCIHIWAYENSIQITPVLDRFMALGCADEFVLGYLAACDVYQAVDKKCILNAIDEASMKCVHVGLFVDGHTSPYQIVEEPQI